MTEKEHVLCMDVIQALKDKFIFRGWITVSSSVLHSALVTDDKIEECLRDYQWDLTPGRGGAYVNTWGEGSYEYVRDNRIRGTYYVAFNTNLTFFPVLS